jgi:hypothetical protein
LKLLIAGLAEKLFDFVGVLAFGFSDVDQQRFYLLIAALVGVDAALGNNEIFHLQGVFQVISFFVGDVILIRQYVSPPLYF